MHEQVNRFRPSFKAAALLLAAMVLGSVTFLGFKSGGLHIASSDSREYLATAYHISRHHIFTPMEAADAVSGIGREPGYPLFLAGLMSVDPGLATYTPGCLQPDALCDPRIYRSASLANLFFIEVTGVVIFLLVWRLSGDSLCALVAAAYLLFNLQMDKGWADPMSDRLAVLLVSLAMLAAAWAWRARQSWRWSVVGVSMAAVTLTKAVFVYYFVLAVFVACAVALLQRRHRRQLLIALAIAGVAYALPVGGWMLRNWQVSGSVRLTDTRGSKVLSEREAFDQINGSQYLASFVYWTRGFGAGLARQLFSPPVIEPFDLYREGGFYAGGNEN